MSAVRTEYGDLVEKSLVWLVACARPTEHGVAWVDSRTNDEIHPDLYGGGAGIMMTLLEAQRHYDDQFGDLALQASHEIAANIDSCDDSSLYFGLTGLAVALQSVHELLGDALARSNAVRALEIVLARFDGERWSDQFELLGGNAGIALGALRVGDHELALTAVTPYLERAEVTSGGVNWEVRKDVASRLHHISHGTLGIVEALASVGAATNRGDLIELALAGAADVVGRNESRDGGFLVPHSDPPWRPEVIARHSYGWCHGAAGDAQVFRLLSAVTGDGKWMELTDQCWRTLLTSRVPERVHPGFWDNSGRCCGTAGVLAFACDRYVERDGNLEFARVLVEDLGSRATIDGDGARWSNFEHRVTPSELEPRTGWAMGNAGIIRELLRFNRICDGQSPDYFVRWPDQPTTGPKAL